MTYDRFTMRPLLLPFILPVACCWITRQERRILAQGETLCSTEIADAEALGIAAPARIRLLYVERVPLPADWLLRATSSLTGVSPRQIAGLSARHGIFIQNNFRGDRRLLAHELAHTCQYERLGGIRPFLKQYLRECLTVGYHNALLELEAHDAADALCQSPGRCW